MDETQGYLISAYLAASAKFNELEHLLNASPLDISVIYKILLSFTPELVQVDKLKFLTSLTKSDIQKNTRSVAEIISKHQELDDFNELSLEILSVRLSTLKSFISEQSHKYGLNDNSVNFNEFLKARIRKIDSVTGELHFNQGLFELLDDVDWYNKNIAPLDYLTDLSGLHNSLIEWESLNDVEHLKALYYALRYKKISTLQQPFKNYLNLLSADSVLLFLKKTEDIADDLEFFNSFILEVSHRLSNDKYNILVDEIIKVYSQHPHINTFSLSSITTTLNSLPESPKLAELSELAETAKVIHYDQSLKQLESHFQTEESQLEFFINIISQISTETTTSQIYQLNSVTSNLFTKIPKEEQTKLLTQRLLNLKLFSLITYQIDDSLIIQNFWKFFKSATNGSKSRGDLQSALKSLSLIKEPTEEVKSLQNLVDSIDKLTSYSIYLQKGTPFKPSDLLTLDDGLDGLLRRLLELNDEAYKTSDDLNTLFVGLSSGLDLDPVGLLNTKLYCIESALTHDDFWYAFELSVDVLKDYKQEKILSDNWFVFFQVSKYISAKWLDTESPSEVIEAQMKLISKTLKITPLDSVQIVIQQWNSLELELSLRKEMNESIEQKKSQNSNGSQNYRSLDQRLARGLTSAAADFLNDNSTDSLGGKLVSGLASWATGSKN